MRDNGDQQSQYNRWHLFVPGEKYKMDTFLHSELWCSELSSIIGFDGDIERTQPFGLFVSCWHRSNGDPTPRAWEIFGGCGNGFALRAEPAFMQVVAKRFSSDQVCVRFGEVRYLAQGEKPTDAAFEVVGYRTGEEEARLAISFPEIVDLDDRKRTERIRNVVPAICSEPHATQQFQCMTFVEYGGDHAIILPVAPEELIQEIVIGPGVSIEDKYDFVKMLEGSQISSRVRK